MSKLILVEKLSKKFIIGHEKAEKYTALRDVMARNAKKVFSFPFKLGRNNNQQYSKEEFWALRDVNFSVNQGERIGIIGRNGAGKSTLLKVLSRITEPTEGRITIRGRVASLLEVGTGFHPELTGRENIFLNGAILGMSRTEIRKKFDEIVAFAEVEKFLDTPVKRYSSGMYVRLAFAVAAHLEPEILVVDEVLAVGDAQFQKKCLGKMQDVSTNEGRTVLFVSHQMDAIEALTTNVIYLKGGQVQLIGETKKVVNRYLHDFELTSDIKYFKNRSGNQRLKLVKLETLVNETGNVSIKQGTAFKVIMGIEGEAGLKLDVSLVLENFREQPLFCSHYSDRGETLNSAGYAELEINVNVPYLRKGDYLVSIALFRPDKSEFYDVVLHFPLITIEGADEKLQFPVDGRWGDMFFPLGWRLIN